jgi:hypothetical protein
MVEIRRERRQERDANGDGKGREGDAKTRPARTR